MFAILQVSKFNRAAVPIPNDVEKREWIDVSNINPYLVNLYRPCLIAIVAFDRNNYPHIAGCAFTVGVNGEYAIALSAKHVFTGAGGFQRPARHAPSAVFFNEKSLLPSLSENELRGCWMGSESADFLFTRFMGVNDNLDIASAIFEAQREFKDEFKPSTVLIDANEPVVGDVVHMISLDKFSISNYSPQTNISGTGWSFSLNRRVSIRVGTVTAVYPKGHRQHKFPCFSTSIPADPGMSGGMVFVPADGKPISICGVVSSDFSCDEARTNQSICGESLVASAWPSLSLPLPEMFQSKSATTSIYDLMNQGRLPEAVGIDKVFYQQTGEDSATIVNYNKKA